MPQVGPMEILVVAMIALIVFGPEKLPGILRSVGKTIGELRRMATEVTEDFRSGLDDPPPPPAPSPPDKAADGGPE